MAGTLLLLATVRSSIDEMRHREIVPDGSSEKATEPIRYFFHRGGTYHSFISTRKINPENLSCIRNQRGLCSSGGLD